MREALKPRGVHGSPIKAEGGLHHAVVDLLEVDSLEFVPLCQDAEGMGALAGLIGVCQDGVVVGLRHFSPLSIGVVPLKLGAVQVLHDLSGRHFGVIDCKLCPIRCQTLQAIILGSFKSDFHSWEPVHGVFPSSCEYQSLLT